MRSDQILSALNEQSQASAQSGAPELDIFTDAHDDKFPWLMKTEERHFLELLTQYPNTQIFQPDAGFRHKIIRFDDKNFGVLGDQMGGGWWGDVYIGLRYRLDGSSFDIEKCVFKCNKNQDLLLKLFVSVSDTCIHCKMIEESKVAECVHHKALRVTLSDNGETKTYIMLPYLGNMSLGKLLSNPELCRLIPCHEWLKLFIVLAQKLNDFHLTTNKVHYDIKPDNIGISLNKTNDGFIFTQINIFDFGNAHEKFVPARGSISRYHPWDSGFGLFDGGLVNQTIDIYSLGITMLDVIEALTAFPLTTPDPEIYQQCKLLAETMASRKQADRPPLTEVSKRLKDLGGELFSSVQGAFPGENISPDPSLTLSGNAYRR